MMQRPSKEELSGMTMNERLFSCGLMEAFDAALRNQDTAAFAGVLTQVGFTEDQAKSYISVHFESLRKNRDL